MLPSHTISKHHHFHAKWLRNQWLPCDICLPSHIRPCLEVLGFVALEELLLASRCCLPPTMPSPQPQRGIQPQKCSASTGSHGEEEPPSQMTQDTFPLETVFQLSFKPPRSSVWGGKLVPLNSNPMASTVAQQANPPLCGTNI